MKEHWSTFEWYIRKYSLKLFLKKPWRMACRYRCLKNIITIYTMLLLKITSEVVHNSFDVCSSHRHSWKLSRTIHNHFISYFVCRKSTTSMRQPCWVLTDPHHKIIYILLSKNQINNIYNLLIILWCIFIPF